jgi:hypothetical protein
MKNLDAPAVKRETEEDWGGAGGELQSRAGNSSTPPSGRLSSPGQVFCRRSRHFRDCLKYLKSGGA